MSLEELQKKRAILKNKSDTTLNNMQKIYDESLRTADVAHDSVKYLDDFDKEFEFQTGLQGNDIKYLFAAVALQMARIVIINELSKIEVAGSNNRNETKLHEFQEKILGHFNSDGITSEAPYYASMEHIVTKIGVPYDATEFLTVESCEKLLKKNKNWEIWLPSMVLTEKPKLFKGANHRFATLGHDPILGLIFGTSNILTNTITCVKTPVIAGGVGIPVLTTNHVIYTSTYTDPRIAAYASTAAMLNKTFSRAKEQPSAFIASLIKQIIHIGTDLFTPCGIQIPASNLVLSNTQVERITKYVSTGDLLKIGASTGLSALINLLISTIHMLMYDPTSMIPKDVYAVRTRKIVMYSNTIATGSNVLWVAGNMAVGNKYAIKQLDIGGLIITIKRLMTDTAYIRKIKEEFVFGGFNQLIQGDPLQLETATWD